ncbi:MAG TPA: hypothetical protein VF153_02175 [Candidatus Limnocylindria bacterium]
MPAPIVFISISRILERDAAAFDGALAAASSLIETTKPRTALFGAYVDAGRAEVRIVHVFRDAQAMAAHFEGSDERTNAVAQLLMPISFEVYGDAPAEAIAVLRRESEAAGGTVRLWPYPAAGYVREPR